MSQEASPLISQEMLYLIEIKDIHQSNLIGTETLFIYIWSPEFSQFKNFERHNITFQTYPTLGMIFPYKISPLGSEMASTLWVTTWALQLTMTSVVLSLPYYLIRTRTMGINLTSNAITVGGQAPSSLVTHSYICLFTVRMSPWTPTTSSSINSQPNMPSIPVVL